MSRDPKRRFLKLEVDELSVVDVPANEVEFLVAKSMDLEENMAGQSDAPANIDRVPVEHPVEGDEAEVAKALKHVNDIVNTITQAFVNKSAEAPAAETPAAEAATEEDDVTKSLKGMLKTIGLEGKAADEAIDKLKKAGFDPKKGIPSFAKTTKATTEEPPVEEASTPLTIDGLTEAIAKAAVFTPGRVEKLKEAMETLKMLLEAVAPNTSPKTKTPGNASLGASGVNSLSSGAPEPVVKAAELTAILEKALQPFTEKLEGVVKEVETIKSARPPSNSLESDDNATSTPTAKSIWSGVL